VTISSIFLFAAIPLCLFRFLNPYPLLFGIPFAFFSLKNIYVGLQVYSYKKDKIYLRYLWAYLLLSTIFQFLITYSSIRTELLGQKPCKHFKGPRP
ncbi:MAG: hypothetical protein QME59_03410, partial [Candidatus Hydrothermarchaeota archaeon]|nr:hypothetical protein [Candidatus Hydrothermarchaeota archaeon]